MNALLELSVKTRLFAFVLAALLGAWGYYAYSNLTIEAFPDPTDKQVQVITLYNGQPTEEVERRVSLPPERGHQQPAPTHPQPRAAQHQLVHS